MSVGWIGGKEVEKEFILYILQELLNPKLIKEFQKMNEFLSGAVERESRVYQQLIRRRQDTLDSLSTRHSFLSFCFLSYNLLFPLLSLRFY